MSFKAVILLRRRDDMTAEDFRHWWLDEHAPLTAQLPGVRRITFNVVDDATQVDGVSELWFDSRDDFDAAYETDHGKAVAADSMAHVRSRTRLFVIRARGRHLTFGRQRRARTALRSARGGCHCQGHEHKH